MRDLRCARRQTGGQADDYLVERLQALKRPPLASAAALFGLGLALLCLL